MTALKTERKRMESVDSIRGFIILLMILEHSRYALSGVMIYEFPGVSGTGTFSSGAGIIRSLSHLCAPGFFFILGVCVVLAALKDKREEVPFVQIIKRGVLLIGLQLTLVNFGWALPHFFEGNPSFAEQHPLYLGVLFSLGTVYILSGIFYRFSGYGMAVFLMGITGIGYLFDYSENLLSGLLIKGIWEKDVEIPFPLFPWMALSIAGIFYARIFFRQSRPLLRWLPVTGFLLAAITAFAIFMHYPGLFYKYPPSLPFLMINGLIIASLISLFSTVPFLNLSWLRSIGRHPLLLYVLHIYLIGIATIFFKGDHLMKIIAVAILVTMLCVIAIRIYESDLFMGPYLNVFNIYHRVYDRFMRLFSLYRPEEIQRSLSFGSDNKLPVERKSGGPLLDLAGGTGYIAKQLKGLFKEIIIFDLSFAMLKVAKERNLMGVRGSAHALPFGSNAFTAIICTEALHHIKDATSTVKEMRRVLKTGGRIVIQEFHIKGITGLIFFLFERLLIDRSEFLTPKELERLMADHGFCGTTRPISKIGYIYEGYLNKGIGKKDLSQT